MVDKKSKVLGKCLRLCNRAPPLSQRGEEHMDFLQLQKCVGGSRVGSRGGGGEGLENLYIY